MEAQNGPPRASKRWSPWALFFLGFGLLVLLLVGIVTIGGITFSSRASARVEQALAEIREAGEPTSAAELEAHYRLPLGMEDTTDLWLDATRPLGTDAFTSDAGELPIVGSGSSEIPLPGEPWADLEAAEELLQEYGHSLDLMHQAAELGGAARYPTDFSLGLAMLLEHAQNLRGGARLLLLESHVLAHRGDLGGAARSIHAILMLARSLEREPVLVSELVRLACDGIAREQLEALLPTVDFSDEDLVRLQNDLRAIDYHENLCQAMIGERVIGIVVFESPDSSGLEIDVGRGTLWRFTQRGGFVVYLQHMDRMVLAAKLPWPQALQDAERADSQLETTVQGASFLTKMTHLFPALIAPAVSAAFTATARNVALNGAADAAIAVELFRRKRGSRPERLEQLVPEFLPEVPVDPYDGEPLRYTVDGDRYRIYSVGENRMDDGGSEDEGPDGVSLDYVFSVGNPHEGERSVDQEKPREP